MSGSRIDPRCEKDSAVTEPWIDILSKAFAGGVSRRTALKILAGAALASVLGVTAGCGNTLTDLCPSCGTCTACNVDTTTNTSTCSACTDSCAAKTLCNQASNNSDYKALANYLDNQDFTSNGAPSKQRSQDLTKGDADIVRISQDGSLALTLWQLHYSHPQSANRSADLYYLMNSSNEVGVAATVSEGGNTFYGLYVNSSGQITQKTLPQPTPSPTTQDSSEEQSLSTFLSPHRQMQSSEIPNTFVSSSPDQGLDLPSIPMIPDVSLTCAAICGLLCGLATAACHSIITAACAPFVPPTVATGGLAGVGLALCVTYAKYTSGALCGAAAGACASICAEQLCFCWPRSFSLCHDRDGGNPKCCSLENPVCCTDICCDADANCCTGIFGGGFCCRPDQFCCGNNCCDSGKGIGCCGGNCCDGACCNNVCTPGGCVSSP